MGRIVVAEPMVVMGGCAVLCLLRHLSWVGHGVHVWPGVALADCGSDTRLNNYNNFQGLTRIYNSIQEYTRACKSLQ